MTRIYRFRSWFWFLIALPVAGIALYDLTCRVGFACGSAWPASFYCPATGVIACSPGMSATCLLYAAFLFLVSLTILTYRTRLTIDGDKKRMTTASTLFGFAFLAHTESIAKFTQVTLVGRRHDSGFRIKGTTRDIRVTSYFLEFTGKRRSEIRRFGTKWYARRIGREMADCTGLPFVDATADSAMSIGTSGNRIVPTRGSTK